MEQPKNPQLPSLNLEKAMKATNNYIKELEELKNEGLTEKQAKTLIKFTQEIINPAETEV